MKGTLIHQDLVTNEITFSVPSGSSFGRGSYEIKRAGVVIVTSTVLRQDFNIKSVTLTLPALAALEYGDYIIESL